MNLEMWAMAAVMFLMGVGVLKFIYDCIKGKKPWKDWMDD